METQGRTNVRIALALALAASVGALAGFRGDAGSSGDTLAVREGRTWVTWWHRNRAPHHWGGRTPLADRVSWRSGVTGLEWGELQL
ncbi:MAG TPA: hypothetical protein VFZ87_12900, partial [Gemmatimonadales bacterium]